MPIMRDDMATVPLYITAGDDWDREAEFTDDDGPIDITGSTFEAKVFVERDTTDDALATITMSVTDGPAGLASMSLASADTTALGADPQANDGSNEANAITLWYEVRWTDSGGKKRHPFGGPVIVGSSTL